MLFCGMYKQYKAQTLLKTNIIKHVFQNNE